MKRQFAKSKMAIDRIMRNAADGDKQAKRDRKIEMRALLDQIGRRQIDRYPPAATPTLSRPARHAPLPRFADGLVSKTHNRH